MIDEITKISYVAELARLLESKTPAPLQFENGTRLTKYLKLGMWTPEEAAFLVCGIDADTVQNQFFGKQIKHGKLLTGERITEQSSTAFLHADDVLKLWNRQANPPGKIAPVNFVEWCESKKIDATWLSEIKTAPEEQSDTPAPKVGDETGTTPLPAIKGVDKRKIMAAFQGIKWDYDHWKTNLASPSHALKGCRVLRGNKKASALWNPADIALYLLDEKIPLKKLDAVFVDLNDWADEWREKTKNERPDTAP